MIAVSIKEVQAIIQSFHQELKEYIDRTTVNLNGYLKHVKGPEKSYVELLMVKMKDIITNEPQELASYCIDFEKIISQKEISSKAQKQFREKIIEILDYQTQRSDFYPHYFQRIGIKSCVYCNALLTITVDRNDKNIPYRAKFQVDHYLPKNKFPFLSASLFNLYPVCANCNNVKGKKSVFFNLYEHSPSELSEYSFTLKAGVPAAYLLNRKLDTIEFSFQPPATPKGYVDFDELFDITNIYKTQKDVIEELILRAESYSEGYKETLKQSLPAIFNDDLLLERLIVGNYTKDKDIHKRPLAKFTRDMAEAVGLLKKDK